MRLFIFTATKYFKNFLIILFGLTFAAALIDLIQHLDIIEGFNRKILYFFYIFEDFLFFIYPLALIFGAILSFYFFIEKNYLVAIYSFGYSFKSILSPFLVVSFLIYIIFIALDFTNISYARSNASLIINSNNLHKLNNLFFKYNNNFVFVKELDSVNKKFFNGNLYIIKEQKLTQVISFKEAIFKNKTWLATNVEIKKINYKNQIPTKYDIYKTNSLKILDGYYPKVIKLLYEGKRLSIYDGFRALKLLKKQHINNTKIVSALYNKLIMPLFAPFLIVIIFFNLPIHKRFLNRAKFIIFSLGATLIVWALLYSGYLLSLNGAINPHFAQPLIILLLAFIAIYLWIKNSLKEKI